MNGSETAPAPILGRLSLRNLGSAALAFFLASTVTQSADVWWHLAEGQRLLGTADFWHRLPGGPPWSGALYDVGCYCAWLASPRYGVVAAHAALAAAMAFVAFGGRGVPRGLAALAVATVAVLATGSLASATPTVASLLLLAVAVRRTDSAHPDRDGWRSAVPLAVLFAVWANTDVWFAFGIAVVAATLLGRAFDAAPGARPKLLKAAVGATALVAVACLANPFHVRAFQWPAELGTGRLGSPFAAAVRDGLGRVPAGVAFYALFGLALVSALLGRGPRRWERLLPLALAAALACWDARAIPFFAVVAGPLVARSLSEFLARGTSVAAPSPKIRLAGRGAAVVLAAAFLVAAWPGWLQAPPYAPRGWVVDPPEALALAAETTARWFADGSLPPDAGVFHLSPESARAFAWHAGGLRNTVDAKLSRELTSGEPPPADRLDAAGIRVVVASNPPGEPSGAAFFESCLNDPRWQLLAIRGRVWIVGWRGGTPVADPFQRLLSGGPSPGVGGETMEYVVDPPDPPARHWTDPFLLRPSYQTTHRDRAVNFVLLADASRATAGRQHAGDWKAAHFAGLAGAAAGWGTVAAPAEAFTRLTIARTQVADPRDAGLALVRAVAPARRQFDLGRDDSPLPLLYAAVRAARRATAANPGDAAAHAVLGECYLRLLQNTREREWAVRFPEFGRLRRVQAVAALHRAVTLDPSFAAAHLNLWAVYLSDGVLDLALVHLDRYVELTGQGAAAQGAVALREQVAAREKEYAAGADKLRVGDRAESAVRLGLIGRGRDVLRESDVAAFGGAGAELELNLLLRTGRADEVRSLELGDTVKLFDPVAYRWVRIQALAGTGHYAEAARETAGIVAGPGLMPPAAQRGIAAFAGRFVLDQLRPCETLPALLQQAFTSAEAGTVFRVAVAEHRTALSRELILGLLAFEAGDQATAKGAFQSVLDLSPDNGLVPASPHRDIARQMLLLLP